MMKQYEDREMLISRVVNFTLEFGKWTNSKYEISLHGDHEIKVRDLMTQHLVAYSSTKADFEQSLVEFAEDYFA